MSKRTISILTFLFLFTRTIEQDRIASVESGFSTDYSSIYSLFNILLNKNSKVRNKTVLFAPETLCRDLSLPPPSPWPRPCPCRLLWPPPRCCCCCWQAAVAERGSGPRDIFSLVGTGNDQKQIYVNPFPPYTQKLQQQADFFQIQDVRNDWLIDNTNEQPFTMHNARLCSITTKKTIWSEFKNV